MLSKRLFDHLVGSESGYPVVDPLPFLSDVLAAFDHFREGNVLSYFLNAHGNPFTHFGIGDNEDVSPVDFGDPIALIA